MAASAKYGPEFILGNLTAISAAQGGSTGVVPDPNQDAAPGAIYQWAGLPDVRYWIGKDKLTGWTGMVATQFVLPLLRSVSLVPAAVSSNNIAAAQNVSLGVAMTLAGASLGISTNIPYRPFNGFVPGNTAATAALAIDFGFDFCTTVAGNTTVTVGSAGSYVVGMPLVIAQAGNVAGTAALLTNVVSVGTGTIVVANAPLSAQIGVPVGTGDLWGPNEVPQGFPVPTAAAPRMGIGPGWWIDPRQTCQRAVVITGVSGGAGGNFLVTGVVSSGQTATQLVTIGAGAVTGTTKKTFKYILSVVPQFTDAHNYSVGTTDIYGFLTKVSVWDDVLVTYGGVTMTTSNGFTAADGATATNLTGDVCGTVLATSIAGASNGALVGLVMTGRRLHLTAMASLSAVTRATSADPSALFGAVNA